MASCTRTVCAVLHFFNLEINNSWLQYRSDLQFKLLLGEELITWAQAGSASDSEDDSTPPKQKWKPQPNEALRRYVAIHLPEMVDMKQMHQDVADPTARAKHK